MDTLKALLKKAGPFLTAIFLALTTLSVGNNLFIKKAPDVRLTAALISDTHVGDEFHRKLSLPPGLRDISRRVKPDVLVLTGDCTDNGNEANWAALQELFRKNANVPNTILAVGNHDCWTSYDGERVYEKARANFLQYAGAIMGETPEDVFFSREVGGYSFLVLGSEDDSTDCVMSARQLDWLETALAAAAEKAQGKPVFVINHQPMNFTHAVGADEERFGFCSQDVCDRLQAILDRYPNIFYFCGHRHHPLALEANGDGFVTVERVGRHITSVNLPCYGYGTFLEGGTSVFGQGLVMYVFDDHVQFKGRNFFLSNWSRDFDVSVPLE